MPNVATSSASATAAGAIPPPAIFRSLTTTPRSRLATLKLGELILIEIRSPFIAGNSSV